MPEKSAKLAASDGCELSQALAGKRYLLGAARGGKNRGQGIDHGKFAASLNKR
jgi:hypothetical protein